MANTNLANAKTAKNDEFYTQYSDIQKEMNAYLEYNPDVFRGKTILLPCDDPEWSNFTKFFAQNFESFGIKKLISTSYAVESKKIKEWQPTLFETESPYYDADKSRTKIYKFAEMDADHAIQACIRFRLRHGALIAYTCTSNCFYMYKQTTEHVESIRSPSILRWICQSKQMIYGYLLGLGKPCASNIGRYKSITCYFQTSSNFNKNE